MTNKIDQIYKTSSAKPGGFIFDAHVVDVFADMISRSVPGYQQILEMLPTLTRQFRSENANYYDLGCSLGAGMLAMHEGLGQQQGALIGVDNSAAMIEQARVNLSPLSQKETAKPRVSGQENALTVRLLEQNLLEANIENAAMVLMNFTLQFIPINKRDDIILAVYNGLNAGGAFVLSEKIKFDNRLTNQFLTDIHHQYKADQGYSQLEIAQKRDAIENVLIPETLSAHTNRLEKAGFRAITPWVQNLQFISILAIK